jgi:hypothetical protein
MAYEQWIVDTNCEFYKDFEKLFINKGPDQSAIKTTYNGYQFDVMGSDMVDWKKLKEWVLKNIKDKNIENIEITGSWCVDYKDNGYQALHKHGAKWISVVISLDDQPEENKNGMLYALLQDSQNKLHYKEYRPHKGRTIIMTGRVWHGVYPAKNPRRTFVVDYKILGENYYGL